VAGAGDFDGDGYADLLIGAPRASVGSTASGAAYLIYGPITNDVLLSDVGETVRGAVLVGGPGNEVGISLSGGGDVNGDGFPDLLIGSINSDYAATFAGAAYLVYGGGL
jgi:hypothetical protein